MIPLSAAQQSAVDEAADRLHLSRQQFALRAFAMLCAAAGVEFPPPPSGIKPMPRERLHTPRSAGGRPRQPATWAMDNDIPAGHYSRVCPWCGRAFHHDDSSARYCSERCKKSTQQARTYRRRRARNK